MQSDWREQLERDGFVLIRGVYSDCEIHDLLKELSAVLEYTADHSGSIRSRGGKIYAARNFLQLFPPATEIWNRDPLRAVLREILGIEFGLVRGLYFDKPPDQSWSLPWHQDRTIAVRNNRLPSRHFGKATLKASVPHVEAPRFVLESMLTLRIHLDDVTPENGPLLVSPGSHRHDKSDAEAARYAKSILADSGDVLAMRPLVTHCSGNSLPGTILHRRIIHLEFAAQRELPDGYDWHDFQPGG